MNVVSVSWTDHLSFGEGDGRLDTPDRLRRRLPVWRETLGADALHWRVARARIPGRFSAAPGYRHPSETALAAVTWDELAIVPEAAREHGLTSWLYVSLFDEGWPLASPRQRARSHHNAMHGQHVAWQSELTRRRPEWVVVDRAGRRRQWGVVSLAYPEARRAFLERWMSLLGPTGFDGLFVCCRSQSRPAVHADQFGFNAPALEDYRARYGGPPPHEAPGLQPWRDLLGSYVTTFLVELKAALASAGRALGVGIPRGDVIGPPLGNTTLQWREWVSRGVVDHLVIDQRSDRCPSMWHRLWPMHEGAGYLQDYRTGFGMPPLEQHVRETYAPAIEGSSTRLFLARQWHPREDEEEARLLSLPGVAGLVFSSFRHDNPEAVRRGNWQAGRI